MSNNYSLLIKLLMSEKLQDIIYTYNIHEACERETDRHTHRHTDRHADRQKHQYYT